MTTNARDENWSKWKPWSGGECPIDKALVTEIKMEDDSTNKGKAGQFVWGHYKTCGADIIAYRYKIKEPESTMTPEEEELPAQSWSGMISLADGRRQIAAEKEKLASMATMAGTDKHAKYSAYFKDVRHIDTLDVYRVVSLFDCEKHGHPISHAAKKLLLSGSRTGGKDVESDVREAIDTLHRWLEMREEDARA